MIAFGLELGIYRFEVDVMSVAKSLLNICWAQRQYAWPEGKKHRIRRSSFSTRVQCLSISCSGRLIMIVFFQ